jgi:nanoRNase/pAp phosphatase (c-di-AMP/oligoRNAs hydrolase)
MNGPTPHDRLQSLAEFVTGKQAAGRWLVLTHDNPDPDAIASGALLAHLLRKQFHHRATVAYGGIIGRAENREMVRALGIKLSHVRHLSWKNYRHFALVDSQPRTGNNQLPEDIQPDLVFDHHPTRRATYAAGYSDIRPDYGATATIVGEYLVAADLEFGKREASALVYAIRSETQDFRRESSGPDKRLFDLVYPRADKRAIASIQSPRLPISYFRSIHRALEGMEGVGTLVASHLGHVDQPDIVPEVADLLVRLEGKTWCLCTGVWEDRLYLSLRTTNPRADSGRLMRRLVGKHGKGGGHGMMAGGWISLDQSRGSSPKDLYRNLLRRLAKALKKNPDKLTPIPLTKPATADGSTSR